MRSFYCQLDYEHVPYLSSQGTANGNLANNGCGVCSCSMVAENLASVSLPPEECAALSKASGAREGYGTDLFVFAPYFAQYTGLDYRIAWEPGEALRFLQEKKGMVIANTQGDRPQDGYIGVFPTAAIISCWLRQKVTPSRSGIPCTASAVGATIRPAEGARFIWTETRPMLIFP